MENQAKKKLLRSIPAVDTILNQSPIQELLKELPRKLVLNAIRAEIDGLRQQVLSSGDVLSWEEVNNIKLLAERVVIRAKNNARLNLRKVINATGIIIHTNLGRAPLLPEAMEKIKEIAEGYSNLEYDLEKAQRGSRYQHVEDIIKELSGGESALVVNNNAAAVLIVLNTLAKGYEVIVSRGELIEIGGSFRLPDIMVQSGCRLREVGTTNKTKLSDYEQAVSPETRLILTAHTSNYRILGFTERVDLKDLVRLGHKMNLPVMKDLGSGNFIDLTGYGLEDEPTVGETISSGVDVATFSGDKLLGGPQAGIIVGKKHYLDAIKRNPLLRAIRIDKLTLAALEVTLRQYLEPEKALHSIPVLKMLSAQPEELKEKAKALFRQIKKKAKDAYEVSLGEDFSQAGGGALPLQNLPTWVVTVIPRSFSVTELDRRLRKHQPPIITRVSQERVVIDVRTVFLNEISIISDALARVGC